MLPSRCPGFHLVIDAMVLLLCAHIVPFHRDAVRNDAPRLRAAILSKHGRTEVGIG